MINITVLYPLFLFMMSITIPVVRINLEVPSLRSMINIPVLIPLNPEMISIRVALILFRRNSTTEEKELAVYYKMILT